MSDENTPQATETVAAENLEQSIDQATQAVAVQSSRLDELAKDPESGDPIGLDSLLEVPVRVTVQIGRARMSLGQLVQLDEKVEFSIASFIFGNKVQFGLGIWVDVGIVCAACK